MKERTVVANESMTAVAAISEQHSAIAEEVSAVTEQMTAQIQDMVAAIERIEHISQGLQESAWAFQWTYPDDWRARGMKPSAEPPYVPVPMMPEELDAYNLAGTKQAAIKKAA